MFLRKCLPDVSTSCIPHTNRRYSVSSDGTITDTLLGAVLAGTGPEDPVLNIVTDEGVYLAKQSLLVTLARKLYKYNPRFWNRMHVMFYDGNVGNKHGSNLIIAFEEGGIEDSNGFYLIPGYSQMRITRNGITYSTTTKRVSMISYSENGCGYPTVRAIPDQGRVRNTVVHRLLALAFLSYGKDVDSLDVNHKNGVKTDFDILNIEWATRQKNCEHAYMSGLRNDNKPVLVRNSFTGEIKRFYSLEDSARNLNIDGETVRLRVKSDGQSIYPPGLQFKLESSDTEWLLFEDPGKELDRNGIRKRLEVTFDDGRVVVFNSSREAAEALDISVNVIRWQLARKPVLARRNWEAKYLSWSA